MRQFYEECVSYVNHQPVAGDLQSSENKEITKSPSMGGELVIDEYQLLVEIRQPVADDLNWNEFV